MQFVIPVSAAFHKFIILIRAPWHVFFFEFMPFVGPLLRGQFRMCIADMLKLVHCYTERHKGQCLLQMGKAELVCIITEKPLRIRIRELFHGHGMDLINVRGGKEVGFHRLDAGCPESRKRMSQFMRQDLHISDRLVEAGKYKRRLPCRKDRAVTGGCLVRFVLQVHHLMTDHEVDKLCGLRTHFVIHSLRGADHEIIISCRYGIAIREDHILIKRIYFFNAQSLCLCLV